MSNLLVIKGVNTSIGAAVAIHAPMDCNAKVKNAILVEGPKAHFELWQDVTWYFMIDPVRSALFQRTGADLEGSKILVLIE
jgi:DNA-binding transcriptional regulator/RsmH inhibitor MraZ